MCRSCDIIHTYIHTYIAIIERASEREKRREWRRRRMCFSTSATFSLPLFVLPFATEREHKRGRNEETGEERERDSELRGRTETERGYPLIHYTHESERGNKSGREEREKRENEKERENEGGE